MTEFATVVIYDITNDKLRYKIEKICQKYGMAHIQRSAFVGFMTESMRRQLYVEILTELEENKEEASVRIYRIRQKDYRETLKIGQLEGFDPDPKPQKTIIQ